MVPWVLSIDSCWSALVPSSLSLQSLLSADKIEMFASVRSSEVAASRRVSGVAGATGGATLGGVWDAVLLLLEGVAVVVRLLLLLLLLLIGVSSTVKAAGGLYRRRTV